MYNQFTSQQKLSESTNGREDWRHEHTTYHTQIHRKLHQGTHGIHNIQEPHIYKTTIQIRSSTRRRPFIHTLQHLHFRHTTTTRLSTTDHIRRHNYHTHTDINIANANIQPYLQDILKWTKDNDLLLNTDKKTCTLLGLQIDNTTLPMTTYPK